MKNLLYVILILLTACISAPKAQLPASLNQGLLAYYPFEGNANDESGNASHGGAFGHVTYSEGKIGQAASFDGIDDYIEIIPHSDITYVDDFSFAAWVYLSDWGTPGEVNEYRLYIFDGHSHSATTPGDFYRPGFCVMFDRRYGDEQLHTAVLYQDRIYLEQSFSTPLKGQWRFVVYTRRGDQISTYLDGEIIEPETVHGQMLATSLAMNHPWFIGTFSGDNPNYQFRGAGYNFYGLIDELRLYTRALSADEILALYQQAETVSK